MITPYVTINSRSEFTRNKTGFGYMVYDIAKSLGQLENVSVLTTDTVGRDFEIEGVRYLRRSYGLFIKNVLYCISPLIVLKLWAQYRMQFPTLIRLIYYWMMSGYIAKTIKSGKYDMVHMHQCMFDTEIWMAVCKKCNQRFIVTLHGLNSFSETVHLEPAGKRYERNFLHRVVNGYIHITVISTGILRIIEKTYDVKDCKEIDVVCNSFSFGSEGEYVNIRDKYNLPKEAKIILYVGNVCVRKNQRQFVAAFNKLPQQLIDSTYVLFLGRELDSEYEFSEQVADSPYSNHFIICGNIDKEMVAHYYRQGDAVALISLSEGFGLSLVEGLHFGLPCMSFTDMDAFEDIYDPNVMVGVSGHEVGEIAKGIERLLKTEWNTDFIKDYSIKFEPSFMAENYIKVYRKLIGR